MAELMSAVMMVMAAIDKIISIEPRMDAVLMD
jgi:hypothetical protein